MLTPDKSEIGIRSGVGWLQKRVRAKSPGVPLDNYSAASAFTMDMGNMTIDQLGEVDQD
jgi:hypothetical protein